LSGPDQKIHASDCTASHRTETHAAHMRQEQQRHTSRHVAASAVVHPQLLSILDVLGTRRLSALVRSREEHLLMAVLVSCDVLRDSFQIRRLPFLLLSMSLRLPRLQVRLEELCIFGSALVYCLQSGAL
jgi:hypothetical protein